MKRAARFLAIILTAAMLLGMMPTMTMAADDAFSKTVSWEEAMFNDVSTDDWYYETVKTAYELGLMKGTGDGTFLPEGPVRLAEVITVAARIHAINRYGEENFVQGDVWYRCYVDYALENGILDAELADYEREATRLEFARILSRALPENKLQPMNTIENGAIPDVESDEAVYKLYRAGVLIGSDEKGSFLPDTGISRSEMATIIARMVMPELRKNLDLRTQSTGLLPDFQPDVQPESQPEDYIDENNAATEPYDVINPEALEDENVMYSGDHILIKLHTVPGAAVKTSLTEAGIVALDEYMVISSGRWYRGYFEGNVHEVMEAVRAIPAVIVAEYDFAYSTGAVTESEAVSGNPLVDQQWYLNQNGVAEAWAQTSAAPGSGIIVAVIDSGVDYEHEDLAANMWTNPGEIPNNGMDDDGNGYIDDYYGVNTLYEKGSANDGSVMDDHGHGTHVAGIIAAVNNNIGTVGVAYGAKIMAIKAAQASGYLNQSDIAEAILYAYEMGAQVINMSFGGGASSISVQDALEVAYTRCVLVASAGNDGKPNERTDNYKDTYQPNYPAALKYVLGVMSVGESGVESGFTNWDVSLYNTVEYELYAPGENIMSTLPDGRYAAWNGTSMAAPIVSAMAAIWRSAYPDTSMFPTKYIYGQLVSTGKTHAICCDSEKHTVNGLSHNLAPIVDIGAAMTDLPTPDVGVSDYAIFDDPAISEKNNGDGVIDAGETIALGFILTNRWGMSENTTVTLDTLSSGDISNPYVTINGGENASMDYGSIGTYSEGDCGRIYDDDGMWIGWETPFLVTVSEDCPNDYIIKINVAVSCENALDPTDKSVYSSGCEVEFNIRRGLPLAGTITEDMTLTADNYYILYNSLAIPEGVTVTVEAGTQIQFWSDDADDPYADSYMAGITVDGTLIFNGTADEHIKLFPGERMSNYAVQITARNNGVVKLFYTDVVNPMLTATYAEGCEFTQNYKDSIYYRNVSDGIVKNYSTMPNIHVLEAVNCAFYKMGGEWSHEHVYVRGSYDNCIFADSSIDARPGEYQWSTMNEISFSSFKNCLFYGNNSFLDDEKGSVSVVTMACPPDSDVFGSANIHSLGNKVYVRAYSSTRYLIGEFAKYLGGSLLVIDSQEELDYICRIESQPFSIGLVQNLADGSVSWTDGSKVGDFLNVTVDGPHKYGILYPDTGEITFSDDNYIYYSFIEIPADRVSEISQQYFNDLWEEFIANGDNYSFSGNAIINRLVDTDVTKWLRVQGAEVSENTRLSIAGNYWGTTSENLRELQILDYNDLATLIDIDPGEMITTPPENVWPFVTNAGIMNSDGEVVDTIGNEAVTFFVEFNRPMTELYELDVRFGSYYPYADYQVEGEWVSERRWEGKTTLTTFIENGYQYLSISNGRAADTNMKLYKDWGRFSFEIDTTAAQALIMQGIADENGISLSWTQDDFATLAGYNVYRSDSEDGYYQRLNSSVIPADTKSFYDDTVEPGKQYYYNFTVVQTDLTESEPSGKISIWSKDTMAPDMYHSPVYTAYADSNVMINATVTDNLAVQRVTLYYRVVGESEWRSADMSKLNDKYSAIISSNYVTTAGIEYYIEAYDGVSSTYRGSAAAPYTITVQQPVDTGSKGDVDGNGSITLLDALMVLQAVNDRLNLDSEQFTRADLNDDGSLSAAEALRILQYVNGKVGSVLD